MKTLIYPESVNPYQELLYTPMRAAHPQDTFTYLPASPRNLVLFPFVVTWLRLRGYKVFHLHWHTLYLDKKYHIPGSKLISLLYALTCLGVLKLLGYRVIWTVHNVLPHEPQTTNDRLVARFTAWIATRLIIHSAVARKQLTAVGIDTAKTVVIPHGNYEGVYPDVIDRDKARKRLGIAAHETVVLFFGLIRPYKGVEELVAAFKKLQVPNTRLLIVGRCSDEKLKAKLAASTKDPSIAFHPDYVADGDVAMYFRAADVACIPFQAITTSGSALLALTFGKPLIAPRSGALLDLPENVGYLYDPAETGALIDALRTALTGTSERKKRSTAALAYAKTLSWDTIAESTYRIYNGA